MEDHFGIIVDVDGTEIKMSNDRKYQNISMIRKMSILKKYMKVYV